MQESYAVDYVCSSYVGVSEKEEVRGRVNKLMRQAFASIDCCH